MNLKKILLPLLACSSFLSSASDEKSLELLKQSLNPGTEITSYKEAPIDGFLEVLVSGQVIYVSKDGQNVISGDIYNLKDKYSYTEVARNGLRKKMLQSVKTEDKIIYKAKDEKHRVTVFTDITCPYCTEAHKNIPDYNKLGITVEYMAFPRSGVGSDNAKNMQKIWCAENQTVALTNAKINRQLPKKVCEGNQVNEQYLLGRDIGINSTPTFILESGFVQNGLIGADQLLGLLENSKIN